MRGRVRKPHGRHGSGVVWPDTALGTTAGVSEVFGSRPFAAHIPTVGYDYDFHRGVDFALAAGDTVHSPLAGSIIRVHRTHFGWETATQLNHWTEVDASSAAVFSRVAPSTLRVVGSRVGSKTFAQSAKWYPLQERIVFASEIDVRFKLTSIPTMAAGRVGVGFWNPLTDQYAAIEFDGTNAVAVGVDADGNLGVNGTSEACPSAVWFRVRYSGTDLTFSWSVDGETWDLVATESAPNYSDVRPVYAPVLYWRSTDTDAATVTVDVDFLGWYHADTIARFGNWLEVATATSKFALYHFQDIDVDPGDHVEAGELLGLVGSTGYDDRSGAVQTPHCHLEYVPNAKYSYSNDESTNPIAPGIMPRANVSNNVTVTRSSANDPDGVACHRLRIQVARADQDFDLNYVTLVGNLEAGAINLNARTGLNADNDVPKSGGVYIVPVAFDGDSTEYEVSVYFSKALFGTTFVFAEVQDTAGNVLWSEG